MIRVSEMVLPGHPDKFCDQVADAIVAECYAVDPRAYCQVEVSTWSDWVFLTGGIATRAELPRSFEQVVREVGRDIGYVEGNAVDATRYRIHDSVCRLLKDPREWTDHVNDQSIVLGWAGYDAKVGYLPPEHFLAHAFRRALDRSCRDGRLAPVDPEGKGDQRLREGPDGKLLVRVRENADEWVVEHVLVTLQQRMETDFLDLVSRIDADLAETYRGLRAADRRWTAAWEDIEVLINPNGPLVNGGSDGDNGQTGRKLVMDFYGPRVPIGGGALCGKDVSHIDRAGAHAARDAALHAVKSGAEECTVLITYAPNVDAPLDVRYQVTGGRGERLPRDWFAHSAVVGRADSSRVSARTTGRGEHFLP